MKKLFLFLIIFSLGATMPAFALKTICNDQSSRIVSSRSTYDETSEYRRPAYLNPDFLRMQFEKLKKGSSPVVTDEAAEPVKSAPLVYDENGRLSGPRVAAQAEPPKPELPKVYSYDDGIIKVKFTGNEIRPELIGTTWRTSKNEAVVADNTEVIGTPKTEDEVIGTPSATAQSEKAVVHAHAVKNRFYPALFSAFREAADYFILEY